MIKLLEKTLEIVNLSILIIFALILHSPLNAQDSNTSKTKFSLEIDPGTILMKGFGIHAGINPSTSKKWFTGISVYTLELPEFAVNLSEANKDEGWGVRIKYGLGIYGEYFFKEVNRRWFVATQIGIQQYQLSNTNEEAETEYTLGLLMPYFGYSWKPFKNFDFYLKPWAGIGYSPKLGGSSSIGSHDYETSNMTPLAALHLGYTF